MNAEPYARQKLKARTYRGGEGTTPVTTAYPENRARLESRSDGKKKKKTV